MVFSFGFLVIRFLQLNQIKLDKVMSKKFIDITKIHCGAYVYVFFKTINSKACVRFEDDPHLYTFSVFF